MSRSVNSSAKSAAQEAARRAAEAARRAAQEAARRAAQEAARQAARSQAAKPATPRQPVATRDTFSSAPAQARPMNLDGAATRAPTTAPAAAPTTASATTTEPTPGHGQPGALPATPEELPQLFPELQDAPREQLEKAYNSMRTLVDEGSSFSERAGALGQLAGQFPDTTGHVLERLGVEDQKLVQLATNDDALGALSTLTDGSASVADKAKAALELANTAGEIFQPEELEGVLSTVLNGLPAAAELAGAIGAFTDPEASPLDKAQASLDLARALRDFAGAEFPQLANELRSLDGTFRAAGAAMTLLNPDASVQDKALAAAQLAAEIPGLGEDLTAFTNLVRQFDPSNADAIVSGSGVVEAAVNGLDPSLASQLTPAQLESLQEAATRVGADELESVLQGIRDPQVLDNLVGQLGSLDAEAGKRLLTTLGGIEHGRLAEVLSDPRTLEQLGSLATKLDDEAASIVGRLAADMDVDGLQALLKFADGVPGGVLKTGLKTLEPLLSEGGGRLVGQGLKLLDDMLGRMGVELTGEVAEKVFRNLSKAIPVAGAVPGVIDAVRYGEEAAALRDQNRDLGFFALVGANLNATDAVVGTVLDFTGVGAAVDLGVGVGFGIAELAVDLAFDAEKAKFEADPQNYEAPDWMRAVNLAAAAVMPGGPAQLAAYYGPEGAAELTQWGIERGAQGAVALAEFAGVSSAEAAGDGLEATAGFIRQMADVIRNPSQYGEAVATQAREAFDAALEAGGQLAEEARQVLGGVIDEARRLGAQGLETLEFIAQNPGEAASMAVEGIQNLIDSGLDLATEVGREAYQQAVETLEGLQEGWRNLTGAAREKAAELIDQAGRALGSAVDRAVELGEQGVELLTWAATHPGEVGEAARQAVTDALARGGELARQTWESLKDLGEDGLELAQSAIETLKEAGGQAVETLRYIAENPGQAAAQVRDWVGQTLSDMVRAGGEFATEAAEAIKGFVDRRVEWAQDFAVELLRDGAEAFTNVASAWAENLTEGGREILSALADLGSAGVDALQDLANAGGELAEEVVGHLGDLARMGVEAAQSALNGLAELGGEVGRLAGEAVDAVADATDGEFSVFGQEVDVNPFW